MNNVYIRRPASIQAYKFEPWREQDWPDQFIPWNHKNDPLDGSYGVVPNKNGNCVVFEGDWICWVENWAWVVEKDVFDLLYMASLA